MSHRLFLKSPSILLILAFFMVFPLENIPVNAQVNGNTELSLKDYVVYNRLTLRNVGESTQSLKTSDVNELTVLPLTEVEEELAVQLKSHWAWPENTLEIIDSYSPFLFRTKKSAALDEVKLLLNVNEVGRISGFEILGKVDKGLKERLDHMLRKLPDCKPVPGYQTYRGETFELIIKK
ncbi:hypothetical protein PBT90_06390 [Algoriphagus halophytocola]|uniref:Uncharacterized protein n=1 Tax=Algoriphagus halophytocola TaxID=2991499 RepID=A0ABY6MJ03_9BACT|nr:MULTISPECIES: hypothetical protein [unclassified Algoriphagus]UZD23020.1 hypothetical protein OM944_00710 [Algoriphagus sp. TR-M5]WBL44312.1 hypothetical protein PBT90_06390 [Algoriphagus sp. TR-M9]